MQSPLDGWYDKAGVRADPRRVIAGEIEAGRRLFPEHLIPYLSHPELDGTDRAQRDQLVARHLYQYMQFTIHFETRVVNRATERIANGASGLDLPGATRADAHKIYCDEAYHALYSFDVVDQVSAATGIGVPHYDFDPFLRRLDDIGDEILPGSPLLVQMLQVVVFETLVTALLKDIPKDPDVVDLVRDTVRDHAEDEGRHHAYFSHFFRELWTALDPATRRRTALCLPELVRRSLEPDLAGVRTSLRLAGLTDERVATVIADCYRAERVGHGIRACARHSVRLFEAVGVTDMPGGRDAFAAAGLL